MKSPLYSESIIRQYNQLIASGRTPKQNVPFLRYIVDACKQSPKFKLPDGGAILDDPDIRALDACELRLPFQKIVVEFPVSGPAEPGLERSSRRVICAEERGDAVAVTVLNFVDSLALWAAFPTVGIPRTDFVNRAHHVEGFPGLMVYPAAIYDPEYLETLPEILFEIRALLGLLNALQCRNVHVQKVRVPSGTYTRNALAGDEYHVLMIDTRQSATSLSEVRSEFGHRSPREHIRRGHVRRLASGSMVWVQSTVVNAGRGIGKVHKSYSVGPAACAH